jgi:cytochrome c553
MNNILKKLLKILFLSLILFFNGCGNKKENNSQETKEKTINNTTSSPEIEIVTNTNAHETKVVEKEKTKLDVKNGKAYYYDYNVKNKYNENTTKRRTVLDANMNIRSPYERVKISLIAKQLSANFRLKCSACHDDYANGVVGPSLLGKDATFIYNAIIDFKSGKKSNPLMDDLIKKMDKKEIQELANEIYKFNKEIEKLGARE